MLPCLLPQVGAQQQAQDQQSCRDAAAQPHMVVPPLGQHIQAVNNGHDDRQQGGQGQQHALPVGPGALPFGLPGGVVHGGLRLRRFLRLRFLLRLVEQLLGVLKSRTAPLLRRRTVEPLQHRRKTLPQGHRLGDDAVILVLQHRVHRLGHDILQRHPIRRGGLIFRSRDPLLFLDRFRLRNRLRFRNGLRLGRRPLRRLLQDRLTPTLAVLGKNGLQ